MITAREYLKQVVPDGEFNISECARGILKIYLKLESIV